MHLSLKIRQFEAIFIFSRPRKGSTWHLWVFFLSLADVKKFGVTTKRGLEGNKFDNVIPVIEISPFWAFEEV